MLRQIGRHEMAEPGAHLVKVRRHFEVREVIDRQPAHRDGEFIGERRDVSDRCRQWIVQSGAQQLAAERRQLRSK